MTNIVMALPQPQSYPESTFQSLHQFKVNTLVLG